MKEQEKTNLDESLKDMDDHIIWNNARQQHARKMLLSRLEQSETPKRKNKIKRSVVPVLAFILFLGTAGTLVISEFSEQEQISEQDSQVNLADNNQQHGFEILMDEKAEADMAAIMESGFDLQLPQYSPVENTELENIWYRSEGQHDVVSASYVNNEGNEIFKFLQEDISEVSDVNHLQENADYETEINGNVTFVKKNDHSGLLNINMITNEYGFTLSAYHLSEEQLLRVGESIP